MKTDCLRFILQDRRSFEKKEKGFLTADSPEAHQDQKIVKETQGKIEKTIHQGAEKNGLPAELVFEKVPQHETEPCDLERQIEEKAELRSDTDHVQKEKPPWEHEHMKDDQNAQSRQVPHDVLFPARPFADAEQESQQGDGASDADETEDPVQTEKNNSL
ncbi:MAG: hypothetical protein IJT68_06090 [Lentisphaeria bacterium]|nr:hypothetical protein [Lentisphaeria bacterium]